MVANGNKYITWVWLVPILLGLLFTVAGYAVNNVTADVEKLKQDKLDKEVYYRDIHEINKKLDCIYNWHLPAEFRTPGAIVIPPTSNTTVIPTRRR